MNQAKNKPEKYIILRIGCKKNANKSTLISMSFQFLSDLQKSIKIPSVTLIHLIEFDDI